MHVVTGARLRRWLAAGALNILAIGGVLCIALTIAAKVAGVSVIMFSTGSMSPTISTGAAALVRQIPATQMQVGDVVTVRRPGKLPITHRVIAIEAIVGPQVTFRMQGDANREPDLEPYTRASVDKVMYAVPGAAHVIVWFADPRLLAVFTGGATALVAWAFWPRTPKPRPASSPLI